MMTGKRTLSGYKIQQLMGDHLRLNDSTPIPSGAFSGPLLVSREHPVTGPENLLDDGDAVMTHMHIIWNMATITLVGEESTSMTLLITSSHDEPVSWVIVGTAQSRVE